MIPNVESCSSVIPTCCNCGGEHSVACWGCEAIKREVEVQKIRVKEKVSYADAVKIVKAAVYHLGMRNVRWEDVRDELSVQASQ